MRPAISIALAIAATITLATPAHAKLTSARPPAVVLRHIDTNHDGMITTAELTRARSRLSRKLPADLRAWLRIRHDRNKDGVLDAAELAAAWTGLTVYVPAPPKVVLTPAPLPAKKVIVTPTPPKRILDRNRDGRVDRRERHHRGRIVIRHR